MTDRDVLKVVLRPLERIHLRAAAQLSAQGPRFGTSISLQCGNYSSLGGVSVARVRRRCLEVNARRSNYSTKPMMSFLNRTTFSQSPTAAFPERLQGSGIFGKIIAGDQAERGTRGRVTHESNSYGRRPHPLLTIRRQRKFHQSTATARPKVVSS